jgi:hypothetical protein
MLPDILEVAVTIPFIEQFISSLSAVCNTTNGSSGMLLCVYTKHLL